MFTLIILGEALKILLKERYMKEEFNCVIFEKNEMNDQSIHVPNESVDQVKGKTSGAHIQ